MMKLELEILNPLNFTDWDKLVLSTQDYSFFHSSAWAKVLYESYGYKPLYFTLINKNVLSATIPLMEARNLLTGKRGVSLPFSDYIEPIISSNIPFEDVFNYIALYGKQKKWKYSELRSDNNFLQKMTPFSYYYLHTLDLSGVEDKIFSKFRNSTKRNIRKANDSGVSVKISNSFNAIKKYYCMHCMTRKKNGLPPQPFYFFKKIYKHIISKNMGFVVLSSYCNKTIAGAVFFHYGNKAIYKYGASDKAYQSLRANNLVMWEAIKYYAKNGYTIFSFVRTNPDNKGLLQFKRGWGTKEEVIHYYKYDLTEDCFMEEQNQTKSSYSFFKMMPLPILKLTGRLLYRHVC